ncbi:hypothetical protein [Flavihumibacter petaseus]|nr:hypothetical protein [Flavihumibacter petaseus]
MSKITDNLLVKMARGKMGNQFMYKKRGNDTIIARLPTRNKNAPVSPRQAAERELFSEASAYASAAVNNPELKAEYDKMIAHNNNAYNLAIRDYRMPPVVNTVNTSFYTGLSGQEIVVTAIDDFRVATVHVGIYAVSGELLEEGDAILHYINRLKWTYTTRVPNPALAGTVIRAVAKDIPGNEGKLEVTI